MAGSSVRNLAFVGLLAALVVGLAACGGSPTGPTGGSTPDLSGTWSVAGTSPTFDVDGPMTLGFSGDRSGTLRFLGRSDTSGVTACRTFVFALIDDAVLIVDSTQHGDETFFVTSVDENTVTLASDASDVTLTRVVGTSPVADCAPVDLETVATLGGSPSFWTNLVSTTDTLYFNLDTAGEPIVGYDVATSSFGPPRTFTVSAGGGTDRLIMAAFDDDVFYGQCACGGSQRVSRFDLSTNTHLVQVDSETDLGFEISMRYGTFDRDAGHVIVGGRSRDDFTLNRLLVLDPVTLALQSQRTVLRNVTITDLTLADGRLYALLGSAAAIVEIGTDGKALSTWEVARSALPGELRGLEALGGSMYLLVDDEVQGESVLLEATLR
jgi:hypothetical protein